MTDLGSISINPPARVPAVDAALKVLAEGGMVVVTGPSRSGHEGVVIQAAQHVSAREVAFMTTRAGGLVNVAVPEERLRALGIAAMASSDEERDLDTPAMHVGVSHRSRTTGGVSARDRAATAQALADPDSVPGDFVHPGHVFPLAATEGGVLRRPGHAEAALDLVVLAGLAPAAVVCDVARDDGEMAGLDELHDFAATYGLPVVATVEVQLHRRRHEPMVERVAEAMLPLPWGTFNAIGYRERYSAREHLALVHGDVAGQEDVPVRLHTECLWGDVFRSRRCDCSRDLEDALEQIARGPRGVVVYLAAPEGRAVNVTMGHLPGRPEHEVGAHVLRELGVVSALGLRPASARALKAVDHG